MGFGGGNMGKMLMKQMEEMQRKMERIQAELAEERIEATAGGGMVTAVASGMAVLQEVRIKPEVVDPDDVEMLQDLIMAAMNEALWRGFPTDIWVHFKVWGDTLLTLLFAVAQFPLLKRHGLKLD